MTNKLFKSFFAFALVLGSALGFVACEPEDVEVGDPTVDVSTTSLNFAMEEGEQSVEITSNADWKIDTEDVDWITVTPERGNGNATIQVAVSMNDSGDVREATIKVIALHKTYGNWETKKIKVVQSASTDAPVTEELLYGDNFDGKEAAKEYGSSNSSWPYIDQFPEFANPEGPAAANVTYSGSGVSVRANSTSNSSYSDYAGSGSNNIFFGGGAYFQVNDIELDPAQLSYKMTFGSEKYTQDGDSTFKNEEFLVFISKNGEEWAPVEYTFAGTEPGRWNVATANFTLAAGVDKLYIKFEAKVASVYRLDDVKFYVGNGGQTIDLDNIEVIVPEPPTTDALYFENFDGQGAQKDGNYWPYIADFPEMKNAVGVAAANVSYEGYNTTVRNNSNSDGSYSDYAGSGVNNIFFGKDNAWFMVKELALESSQKNLTLTFGTEKYSQSLGSVFTPSEFIVSISGDGQKWSNVEYTFAGTAEGRWNVATANFTLKEVPAKLYIKFMATAESAYRLDDVTLDLGEGGQEIDLGAGSENPGGGEDPDQPENPDQPNVPAAGVYESDSAFVCTTDDSTNSCYGHKDTKIGNEPVTGFKLGTSSKAGYFKSGAVSVSGDKYLNFYAVAWKGKSATLYMRVDGGAATSFELNAHDGATGNPPYAALTAEDQDHYSVKLEGLTETSTIEFSTDASFSAVANDASGRAIVFGMKLTDEALAPGQGGGNEGGEDPTPEPEPTDTMTIAEALAVGDGNTIGGIIEGVVISNMDLNNLTSKKGMYVQDETGALQFYLSENHSFAFGTKVRIDLTSAKLGNYNGAVQVSGVALSKITSISTGNAVAPKTVTMADFLANKYEGQYIALEGVQVAAADLTKTWVMGGAHTSINMEDANGNKFVVFSSKYATYGTSTVAQGSGTISGISSINNGNLQIIFAQSSDYAGLTGERFGDEGGQETTPEPEPTPGDGEWAGRDDFNTVNWNSSYIARQSTAGWVGENCAVQAGGPADANPVFPSLLGSSTDARAWVINGKTSAVGKITSPVITTGCGTLTFQYGMTFTEANGYNFTVDIVQNGEVVKTFNVVNADNTKFAKYTFTEEVNVAGEFQIVITNNCPSAADGNKDRYSIWDIMWTAHN